MWKVHKCWLALQEAGARSNMNYYLYKIINTISGKIYIGVRKSVVLPEIDSYMGSGIAIKSAIKKHGLKNFTKNILEVFETELQMYGREADIVNTDFILREDTYNIALGGQGGDRWTNDPNRDIRSKNLSKSLLARYESMTAEDRKLIYGLKGTKNPFSAYNKTLTREDRQAKTAKYNYTLISPNRELFNTNSLKDFCLTHGLNRDTFIYFMDKGLIPEYSRTGKKDSGNISRIRTTGWSVTRLLILR